MIKKIMIRVGVLTAVFIAAVILFSYITNQGNADMSADMGSATLPSISFTTEGYEVNTLPGYRTDMVLTSMRDTITPVMDYQLDMNIEAYEDKVSSITWQVYSLNGEKCLQEEKIDKAKETQTLKFHADSSLMEEAILKITLHLEDEDIYYYTRIMDATEANYKGCLDYVQNFHASEMNKDLAENLSDALEPSTDAGNDNFQKVTINSDLEHVSWGSLQPDITGPVQWEVKECDTGSTSVCLSYQVRCEGVSEVPEAIYSVKEFFRVRIAGEKSYLLDYERTMEQIFTGEEGSFNQKGVLLGVAPTDLQYKNNSEGTIVSFVLNNELWNYNKDEDAVSLVFSFANAENIDPRNLYDRHDIRIVSVDKAGNTTFTVCGYMNRGIHEGETGVAVYYFDAEKNSVSEKAFVPTTKGYYTIKDELGQYVYYSNKEQRLYVMMDGTLYCVDMEADTREVLVRGLVEGQYTASEDGHLIAYQASGGLEDSQRITVLNLETSESFDLTSEGEDYIRPIGFVKNDLVYGTSKTGDTGQTATGKATTPMYKLEICNQKQKVLKTYEVPDVFISNTYIKDNMITLNRVTRNENIYTATSDDYITNNEEAQESNIMLETYSDETREQIVRLTYVDGLKDSNAKILKPKHVLYEKPLTAKFDEAPMDGKYYVYSMGDLYGVYNQAGYAVRMADAIEGTVISSRQLYVWERWSRESVYEVDNMTEFSAGDGESTLAACLRVMLEKEGIQADVSAELAEGKAPEEILASHIGGDGLDLTGCTAQEVLYTINRETPVIAIIGENHAVLLFGYNKTNVAYLDPADGQRHSVSIADMEDMVNGTGNTFIGYTK